MTLTKSRSGPREWLKTLGHVVELVTRHDVEVRAIDVTYYSGVTLQLEDERAVDTVASEFNCGPDTGRTVNYARIGSLLVPAQMKPVKVTLYSGRTGGCACKCGDVR